MPQWRFWPRSSTGAAPAKANSSRSRRSKSTASVVAEPVIEYSMNGAIPSRQGNRQRGYLQGVYPTADDGEWVAISLVDHVGLDHDVFDEAVTAWTRTLPPSHVVEILAAQGIPAERVLTAERMYELPQLEARNYYQRNRAPGHRSAPLSGVAVRHHSWPRPAPPVTAADPWPTQSRNSARPRPDRRRNRRVVRRNG